MDAVYIPLPNAMHVDWSVRALEAGKHVLCEKPLTRHPEEVERAFDAAERPGACWPRRSCGATIRRRSACASCAGEIGELRLVRGAFSFPLADAGDIRLNADLDGGALMDVGLLLRDGRPLHRSASRARGRPPTAVNAGVDMRLRGDDALPGRRAGALRLRLRYAGRARAGGRGPEGSLFLDDPWHSRTP